jgi:hypothetical protein
MSGYNTRWSREVVKHLLPSQAAAPLLATLWFGANDAALPQGPSSQQHVPVQEYEDNLCALAQDVRATYGVTNILLLTPPPVVDAARRQQLVEVRGHTVRLPHAFSLPGSCTAGQTLTATRMSCGHDDKIAPTCDVCASVQQHGPELGGRLSLDRCCDYTAQYAAAVVRAAAKLQLPVVDLYAIMQHLEV